MKSAGPRVLFLGSHKGGTGKTSAAAALAYLYGSRGIPTILLDVEAVGAASLLAEDESGYCHWPNVSLVRYSPEDALGEFFDDSMTGWKDSHAEGIILIDGPMLTDHKARPMLERSHGVILTCLADPLTLKTIPSGASALHFARKKNPQLRLLGLMINRFRKHDRLQAESFRLMGDQYGKLVLQPPVPEQWEMGQWPQQPGSDLPEGTAREAFESLATNIHQRLFQTVEV
ncbi:Hypothetical protein PBC10988_15220 [Planctomycetales bacterium 10988]|nr:Hypothetical protein PBC10988_15220 [Planctomycetales bacterium 10988]